MFCNLWWLVITDGEVDICLKDPGHEVDLFIRCPLATMTRIWVGDSTVTREKREGALEVTGNSELNRKMTAWIGCSQLASVKPAR